ncbi:hypothetical protein J2X34_000616 [Rhodococcus sp. BE178]
MPELQSAVEKSPAFHDRKYRLDHRIRHRRNQIRNNLNMLLCH